MVEQEKLLPIKDLQKQPIRQLLVQAERLRTEVFAINFQAALGNIEKTTRLRNLRRQIARINTIISMHRIKGTKTNIYVKLKEFQAMRKAALDQTQSLVNAKKAAQVHHQSEVVKPVTTAPDDDHEAVTATAEPLPDSSSPASGPPKKPSPS